MFGESNANTALQAMSGLLRRPAAPERRLYAHANLAQD